MPWLFIIFIIIPVLEMWVLIEVGSVVGAVPTIALVFLTAIVGVTLLKQQGLSTLTSFNQRLANGQVPAQELLSAAFLLVAGAFLLTPGFVTDTIGFLLLMPPIRQQLAKRLISLGLLKMSGVNGFGASSYGSHTDTGNRDSQSGNIYEGSASPVEPKAKDSISRQTDSFDKE